MNSSTIRITFGVSCSYGPEIEIGEDYYVGLTCLEPPAVLWSINEISFYQAFTCVNLPLKVGDHKVVLRAGYKNFGMAFENTWNIAVVPKKSI